MRNWLILITLLVVGALFVPAVSADDYTETFSESGHFDSAGVDGKSNVYCYDEPDFNYLSVTNAQGLYMVEIESADFQFVPGDGSGSILMSQPSKKSDWTRATISDWARCDIGYFIYQVGGADWVHYYISNVDYIGEYPTGMTGNMNFLITPDDPDFEFPKPYLSGTYERHKRYTTLTGSTALQFNYGLNDAYRYIYTSVLSKYSCSFNQVWQNTVNINTTDYVDSISVDRYGHNSNILIKTTIATYTDTGLYDYGIPIAAEYHRPYTVNITNPQSATVFTTAINVDGSIGEPVAELTTTPTPTPASGTINLYVQNSQTGALIAGPRAVISAGFYDPAELIEVSNTTLAGGTKTYTLQPTGGGLPNPDYYRIFVTADGYNSELPYVDTDLEAGLSITMVLGMEPTAGGPEDPGKTYIDVYVRDIYANPIADATVKMGAYTLKTNAAGYTLFDVPVNSTYTYTVKKTGYTSIEGSVTVADAARYPVNIVMGTGVIPTNTPTAEPTVPGDTPTVPAGEETPGTGFMEQSGQAMATFFGVPLAIGKMILGMLIALAIGMSTAKKLKGGAQEFGIGLLGGAMIGVVVGLIPAWVIVVLLLTVGLYIGKMYMSGDAGGR